MKPYEFEGLDFFVSSLFGSDSFVKQYNDFISNNEITELIPRIFGDGQDNVSFNDLLFNDYCDFGKDAIFNEALKKFGDYYSYDEEVVGELKGNKFDFKKPKHITNKSQVMRPKRLLELYANARETNRLYSGIKDFSEDDITSVLREIRDKGLSRPYQLNLDMIRNMYGQFEKAKTVLGYIKAFSNDGKKANELIQRAESISNELLKMDRDFIKRDSFDIEDYLDSDDGIKTVARILGYKQKNASIDTSFYNPKRAKGLDFLEFSGKENLIKEGSAPDISDVVETLGGSSEFSDKVEYYNLINTFNSDIITNRVVRCSTGSDLPYLIILKQVYNSTISFGGEIDKLREILCDIENLKRLELSNDYANIDFDEKRAQEFSRLLDEINKFKDGFKPKDEKYKDLELSNFLSEKYGNGKGYLYFVLSLLTEEYGKFYSEILKEINNFEGHINRKDTNNLILLDIDGKTTELYEYLKGHITQIEPSIGKAGEIFSESGAFGTLYRDIDRMKERILEGAKESEGNISGDNGEPKTKDETSSKVVGKVKLERVYDLSRYKCWDTRQYVEDVSKVLKEKLGDEFPDKFSDIFDVKIYAKDDDPNKIFGKDRLKCIEDRLNVIFNQRYFFSRPNDKYKVQSWFDELYETCNDRGSRKLNKELRKMMTKRDISILSYDSIKEILDLDYKKDERDRVIHDHGVPYWGDHGELIFEEAKKKCTPIQRAIIANDDPVNLYKVFSSFERPLEYTSLVIKEKVSPSV